MGNIEPIEWGKRVKMLRIFTSAFLISEIFSAPDLKYKIILLMWEQKENTITSWMRYSDKKLSRVDQQQAAIYAGPARSINLFSNVCWTQNARN